MGEIPGSTPMEAMPQVPPEVPEPEKKDEMEIHQKDSGLEVPKENELELPKKDEFESYKNDKRYQALLQEASLNYLKTQDSEWFYKEFSGELSADGYLIDKKGKETNFLPSQNINKGFDVVEAQARARFVEQYPEDAQNIK